MTRFPCLLITLTLLETPEHGTIHNSGTPNSPSPAALFFLSDSSMSHGRVNQPTA